MSTRPILKSSVPKIHKALCYFESTATNPALMFVSEIADVMFAYTSLPRKTANGEKKTETEKK